jgi:hypothetical protein
LDGEAVGEGEAGEDVIGGWLMRGVFYDLAWAVQAALYSGEFYTQWKKVP